MLIVSLSSIPPRFSRIGPTLQSLLRQTASIDRICLYIPTSYRRFPDWDGALPDVPDGIEIRRTEHDFGPATKILPAAQEFAGQDCEIVFCDDDRIYGRDFVADFVHERSEHPDCAIANLGFLADEIVETSGRDRPRPAVRRSWRATDLEFQLRFLWKQIRTGRKWRSVDPPWRHAYKRAGHVDIFEGCGGVMLRPDFIPPQAFDIPPVLWSVDDIWLSGMLALNAVPIWLRAKQFPPAETDARVLAPLAISVIEGADRITANRMAAEYFQKTHGIWL